MRASLVFIAIMVWTGAGAAAEQTSRDASPQAGGARGAGGFVQQVTDGDTVVLDDGRRVRLLGINAPELYPVARAGAMQAKEKLRQLVEGKHVTLHVGRRAQDRHGRWLAHLCRDEDGGHGTWVQGRLLAQGWAWVYTLADNAPGYAAAMLERERQARQQKRGLWGMPDYGQGVFIIDADRADEAIGTFRLVEGVIYEATLVRDVLYLNFGENWRNDFTIRLKNQAVARFQEEGFKPLTWAGKSVLVRGWLQGINGALIDATHPQQITLLPITLPAKPAPTPCAQEEPQLIDSPR